MECDANGVCRVHGAEDNAKDEVQHVTTPAHPTVTSSSKKTKIRVDIISDNVCPWCWVGKRKMEKAMKAFPSVNFEVDWHPFFLSSPHAQPEPVPVLQSLTRKYGPGFARMNAALKANGEQIGIKFNDDRIEVNTLNSHRLVEYSKRYGIAKQNEMIEAIFEAYFSHARDISKIDVLVDIAKTVGLNGDEVKQFLEGREFADKVVHEAESKRRQFRVTGVPFFLISREGQSHAIKLSGAQDPATFAAAFGQLLED